MKERAADPVPFETTTFVPGRRGINIAVAADQLELEQAVMRVNLRQNQYGRQQVRPGQTIFVTGGGPIDVHSMARLDLPRTSTFIRFGGAGTLLARGINGPLGTVIDTGYSGNPLTLTPYRPALTGDSWMIVADTNKDRQVSPTGAPIALGLAKPAAPVGAALAEILTTAICAFDTTAPSSVAANWTLTAGVDRSAAQHPADPPTAADAAGLQGNCVEFTTHVGEATEGYSSIMGISRTLNLSTLQGGAVPASDQDIIHLWIRTDRPDLLEELRIYLVCSTGFNPAIIPGTDPGVNTDAFVKAISPSSFTNFVANLESAVAGGGQGRSRSTLQTFLAEGPGGISGPTIDGLQPDLPVNPSETPGKQDGLATQTTPSLMLGSNTWSEFGNIGRPLRRGEFSRIGNDTTRSWATITGIILVIQTNTNKEVLVACDDWFLTGGFNLDTADATDTPYDWRYVHYHTVTGDMSNPSPEMDKVNFLECLRQRVDLTPVGYGDSNVRQRFFRRGGALPTDWFLVGQNASDGAVFRDDEPETALPAADTLELDNDQPISTVNDAGSTILAQPLPVLFGPIEGQLFGLGDPWRPGHLYYSKVERAGSWPPGNVVEVCPPTEQLMTGFEMAGQGWVQSRKKLYSISPNLTGNGQVAVQSTQCLLGITGRWAGCPGPAGWYFVHGGPDTPGIYVTAGGAPKYLSGNLIPIFEGKNTEDFFGIDMTDEAHLRLAVSGRELFFCYTDTNGTPRTLVMDLITEEWYTYSFASPIVAFFPEKGIDDAVTTFMGGRGNGTLYTYEGENDNGVGIVCQVRTGAINFERPREDKLLGDVLLHADIPTGVVLTLQVILNDGSVLNTPMTVVTIAGFRAYLFDAFGIGVAPSGGPQRARTAQFDWSWTHTASTTSAPSTGPDGRPIPGDTIGTSSLKYMGVSTGPQPDQIMKRATMWEHLNARGESYLTGIEMIIDTGGGEVTMRVERTLGGDLFPVAQETFSTNGQRLKQFSWPVVKADQVRLRFIGDCEALILWKCTYLWDPEPPRISKWDSNWENLGDSYYTGLDLECDTFGQEKQIQVWVDQVNIPNPDGSGFLFLINTTGRSYVHLTLGPARGHIYRFTALDGNVGLLYSHKWHLEAEPSEQHNWNQNYSIEGTLGDKAIKGILLECDTFNQAKTVRVEVDGVLHVTRTVQANGRSVVQLSWPQAIGRVIRILPTDQFPGRLYTRQWVFDEEPLQLVYWETQEVDHGFAEHQILFGAQITIKSTVDVEMKVTIYDNDGDVVNVRTYTLLATGGLKKKRWVKFFADKGVLFKYQFTSVGEAVGHWLYREESSVLVLPWGATQPVTVRPFGSDDLDKVRSLSRAGLIAANPGGGVEVGTGRS